MPNRPWSLTPYSLSLDGGEDLFDTAYILGTILCIAGIGDEEQDTADIRLRILAITKGSISISEKATGICMIKSIAIADVVLFERSDIRLVIANISRLGAISNNVAEILLLVGSKTNLGSVISEKAIASTSILVALNLGVESFQKVTVTEIISCLARAVASYQEVFYLQLTIPPGSVLIINSESFTATLDGENVLDLVDPEIFVDENVLFVHTDSGMGGAISGSLRYEERWL